MGQQAPVVVGELLRPVAREMLASTVDGFLWNASGQQCRFDLREGRRSICFRGLR